MRELKSNPAAAHGAACICDWPDHCGGSGLATCRGCGGDQCVCLCGGEDECPGCHACAEDDDGDVWGDYMADVLAGKSE